MSGKVTESIWNGESLVVPLADVQHVEKLTLNGAPNGLWVITKHTTYDMEHDVWMNPIYIGENTAKGFMSAWCRYRSELEADTLMDFQQAGVTNDR